MKITQLLDKIWVSVMILGGIIFYILMFGTIIVSFKDDGITSETLEIFFGFMAIILLSFSYLIMVYIGRTKKDIEILEIMEQQRKREDGYMGQIAFMENAGPIGTGYIYLDHGGFFLLPFIQKRKNYKDIDVKKIPFKKKFPFILLFICFFSVPVLGLIAWLI